MELRVEYQRLNQFFADYTHNISQGGLFIRTDDPLEEGKTLRFRIEAPQIDDPLVLKGTVRRVVTQEDATEESPAGMGVAFVFDSERQRLDLEDRVEELMVRSLGPIAYEALTGLKPKRHSS